MRIFVTEEEIVKLAETFLDIFCPCEAYTHDYAALMDMVYCKELDMYEDVYEVSLEKRPLPQPSDYTNNKITLEEDLP